MTVSGSGDFFEETLSNFLGKANIGDTTKYNTRKGMLLVTATNIDIDNSASIDRRDGLTPIITGNYSSLYPYGEEFLAIKDDKDLVRLYQSGGSWTYSLLLSGVGGNEMRFVDTGRDVYMTNGIVIKKYDGSSVSDLDSVTMNMKIPMIAGDIIEYWKNSLIVSKDSRMYMSDINKFEMVDGRTGVKAFPGTITMVEGLSTGIWVGTTKGAWFLFDKDIVGQEIGDIKLKHFKKLDFGGIKNSSIKVYNITTNTGTYNKKDYDEAVMFVTTNGVIIAGDDGNYENLTSDKYEMPSNVREAISVYRKTDNKDQFMTVLKY